MGLVYSIAKQPQLQNFCLTNSSQLETLLIFRLRKFSSLCPPLLAFQRTQCVQVTYFQQNCLIFSPNSHLNVSEKCFHLIKNLQIIALRHSLCYTLVLTQVCSHTCSIQHPDFLHKQQIRRVKPHKAGEYLILQCPHSS